MVRRSIWSLGSSTNSNTKSKLTAFIGDSMFIRFLWWKRTSNFSVYIYSVSSALDIETIPSKPSKFDVILWMSLCNKEILMSHAIICSFHYKTPLELRLRVLGITAFPLINAHSNVTVSELNSNVDKLEETLDYSISIFYLFIRINTWWKLRIHTNTVIISFVYINDVLLYMNLSLSKELKYLNFVIVSY